MARTLYKEGTCHDFVPQTLAGIYTFPNIGARMDPLHDVLLKQLKRAVPTMAMDLVSAKLKKQGVKLSAKEKQHFVEAMASGLANDGSVNLQLRKWQFWSRREVPLEFTPEELQNLEEQSSAFADELPDLLMSLIHQVSDLALTSLKHHWPRENKRQHRALKHFYRVLLKRWHHGFDSLSMLIELAKGMGENINDELRIDSAGNRQALIEAVTRLHARACQVASEILCLLKQGYADGAIARWRTLHEIAMVVTFIQENGEDVATRYIRHEAVELYRASVNYHAHSERLGETPLDPTEMESIRESYESVIEQFGHDFSNKYGWAAVVLRNPSPTFADIERAVGLEHLRPYYKMASYNVHAEPRGAFFRLGLFSESQILLAGPTNYGFAVPGRNTARSLMLVSSALAMLHPTLDSLVALQAMIALSREAADAFVEIQIDFENEIVMPEIARSGANAS